MKHRLPPGYSFIEVAQKVLAKSGRPMKCAEIIEQARKSGLLRTHAKTPEKTLHAILTRNMNSNGVKGGRFKKVDAGLFALTEQGKR